MSVPVIKPFIVTSERGEDGKVFLREHYTRDDLVRVAIEARESARVRINYEEEMEVAFDETSDQLVDRLTKGKT